MGRVFVPETNVGTEVEYFVTPNQAGEVEPFRLINATATLEAVTTSNPAGDRVILMEVEDKSQRPVFATFCNDIHEPGATTEYTFGDMQSRTGVEVSMERTKGIVDMSSLWVYEGDRIVIRVANPQSGDKLSAITLSFLPF